VTLLELLIKGILLGFLSSVPLGPIGIICIQRTLGKGRLSGFVSGLGAATSDTILAVIAGLGLSFIINFISIHIDILKLFGGLLVIFIGFRIFFKSPVTQVRERKLKRNDLHTDYLSVLGITLTNPIAIFLFIAVFTGLNLVNRSLNYFFNVMLFTGIFLGASLWWFTLSSLVSKYHDRFRLKNLWWLNKISGVIIALFGLIALLSGIIDLFDKIFH